MSVAAPVQLPEDIEELRRFAKSHYEQLKSLEHAYRQKAEQTEEVEQKYNELKEKYEILRHAVFGRSSEKWSEEDKLQSKLFNETELTVDEQDEGSPSSKQIKSYTRRVRGKRKPLPPELPREEVVHDISEDKKRCSCGAKLKRIGEETSEKLDIIPPQVKVIRHIRPKYACRACEGSGDEANPAVRIAARPVELLPKSIATAGLVSYIITAKYCDALPLYRQEKIFARIGVDMSRGSMARWIIGLGSRLSVLLEELDKLILSGPIVQFDETPIQVHKEPGRENHEQSQMWVARGGRPEAPVVRYMYHATRSATVVRSYLSDYVGFLQTDGYDGYNQIGEKDGIIHVGCLAHVRRKFDEATKVSGGSLSAEKFLSIIRDIYREEKQLRSDRHSEAQFLKHRRERAGPLLEKLEKKLIKKKAQVAPSTALGRAVLYALEVFPRVVRYLESYHLTPDNNAAERAIRPFVIGRRNWLFADTPRGAHASAAFYSLIESAKGANLEPYWYIRYVLQALPAIEKNRRWKTLLPGNLTPEEINPAS